MEYKIMIVLGFLLLQVYGVICYVVSIILAISRKDVDYIKPFGGYSDALVFGKTLTLTALVVFPLVFGLHALSRHIMAVIGL